MTTSLPTSEIQASGQRPQGLLVSGDWTAIVQQLWRLSDQVEISDDDWESVINLLTTTQFEGKSRIAGETAARLVLDRAPPHVAARVDISVGPAPECELTCRRPAPERSCMTSKERYRPSFVIYEYAMWIAAGITLIAFLLLEFKYANIFVMVVCLLLAFSCFHAIRGGR